MASKDGVINAALHHIGESESLAPLTDESTWVARVRSRYDEKVRLLFEKHPWNFCAAVVQLTATDPEPEGWTYGFNKPAKCWRIIRVADSADNMDPRYASLPYEDRGGRVLTNCETTFLKYIEGSWLTKEGSWPQHFADAISAEIALAVCPTTDGNEDRIARIKAARKDAIREAKNWDAMQQPRWQEPPSRWQVGRFGSRYGSRWRENG